jgi:hypothetical protein
VLYGPGSQALSRGSRWFTPDSRGSTSLITDNAGFEVQRSGYGVFGQTTQTTSEPNPVQFVGGMNEGNGLQYLGGGGGYWSPPMGQTLGGNLSLMGSSWGNAAAPPVPFVPSDAPRPRDLLDRTSDFFACWGDELTAGATGLARDLLGVESAVDHASDACTAGTAVGFLHSLALPGPELPVSPRALRTVDDVCFPAGTRIATAEGEQPIEAIEPGQLVLSADPNTGEQSYQRVVRTFVRETDRLLTVYTADGRSIECTPEHPFWVEGKGFIAARRLARSDLLTDTEGRLVAVAGISDRRGQFRVHNFEVEQTHTYYAGGWWVHNACDPADIKLGHEAEAAFRRWLSDHGIGLEPKPGGNLGGPDAVWDGTGTNPGWNWAELKPNNANGRYQGKNKIADRFASGQYDGVAALYLWRLDLETGGFAFDLWATFTR